jgi:type 1 fimbriae regulatory protein FimB/type 1 fimbriae regulatory protein FimE
MAPRLKLVSPEPEKRTVAKGVPAGRPPNRALTREHLTPAEVERLIEAAKDNRQGHRDATMILIAFRHGLRASELVDLRWEQTDLDQAALHVRRVKNGTPATHPLTGRELRALRKLQRESGENPFVFVSERGAPFSVSGFRRMIERAGQAAGLENIRICSDTRPAMLSPTKGRTPGPCRRTSAIGTSRTPCGTRNSRRAASRTSGKIEQTARLQRDWASLPTKSTAAVEARDDGLLRGSFASRVRLAPRRRRQAQS